LQDKINYIEKEWKSIELCPSDHKCSKEIKIKKEISTEELLIETLIHEAKLNNDNTFNEIKEKFIKLIYTDIINKLKSNLNTSLWIEFGRWLEFKKSKRRIVRKHIKICKEKSSMLVISKILKIRKNFLILQLQTKQEKRKLN